MTNMSQLRKQLKKLKEVKKEVEKPYYLFYTVEYGDKVIHFIGLDDLED